jgi:PncC family amidohydrolase
VPGISRFFKLGLIVYADESKVDELGVDADLLAEHGAVSEETARAMAAGAAERTGSDLALAVTGIAGPGGGSEGKPVGLVYIAATIGGWTRVRKLDLGPASRDEIRVQSALAVLELGIEILRSRPS